METHCRIRMNKHVAATLLGARWTGPLHYALKLLATKDLKQNARMTNPIETSLNALTPGRPAQHQIAANIPTMAKHYAFVNKIRSSEEFVGEFLLG